MLSNEVVVYQAPQVKFKTNPQITKKVLQITGNFLLGLFFLGFIFIFGPLLKSEINYQLQKKQIAANSPQANFGQLLKMQLTAPIIVSPDPYFSLVIPKINVKAKIMANIDASNKKAYRLALNQGVAHARGAVFPGMKGTIYLFAHSSNAPWSINQYNTLFYPLYKLEKGDQIIVFFQTKKFNYQVSEKKIVDPSETDFFEQKEKEILVLQTCYPPGTAAKALLVFAQRKSS